MNDEKKREYKRNWTADMRANMTPEEKKAYLKKRRETRPKQTEEQKAAAIERTKKARKLAKEAKQIS